MAFAIIGNRAIDVAIANIARGSFNTNILVYHRNLRDKTMADKLMYIFNDDKPITPSVHYNLWLKRLNT